MDKFIDICLFWEKPVFIAGTGRSGTTWLGDLLTADNNLRTIFEPLNHKFFELTKPFGYEPYLTSEDNQPNLEQIMHKIMKGKFRNNWTDKYNTASLAHNRLIKSIRSNLMLSWLTFYFPKANYLYILRDPANTITSQIKTGWWDNDINLDNYLNNKRLQKDYPELVKLLEEEKQHAKQNQNIKFFLNWISQNYVPLQQLANNKLTIINFIQFETLVEDPKTTIEKIKSKFGLKSGKQTLDNLTQKSHTTLQEAKSKNQKEYLSSRIKEFEEKDYFIDIIKQLKVDELYDKLNLKKTWLY